MMWGAHAKHAKVAFGPKLSLTPVRVFRGSPPPDEKGIVFDGLTFFKNFEFKKGLCPTLKKTLCRAGFLSHVPLQRPQCHTAAAEGAKLSTISQVFKVTQHGNKTETSQYAKKLQTILEPKQVVC